MIPKVLFYYTINVSTLKSTYFAGISKQGKAGGEKKSYYYCLICTEHIGSLRKWTKHRATDAHRERAEDTAKDAMRQYSYNWQEIDLQECVVAEAPFAGDPCAQCSDCSSIFFSGTRVCICNSKPLFGSVTFWYGSGS